MVGIVLLQRFMGDLTVEALRPRVSEREANLNKPLVLESIVKDGCDTVLQS